MDDQAQSRAHEKVKHPRVSPQIAALHVGCVTDGQASIQCLLYTIHLRTLSSQQKEPYLIGILIAALQLRKKIKTGVGEGKQSK